MTQLRRCYDFNNSKLTESILTFYELPQPMFQPVWSWWMRPARHSAVPVEAHWGQQSKCSTLRTPRLTNVTWTAVIISLKVTRIQHEVRPHQHHLQQLEWEITQLLQKNITTSIWKLSRYFSIRLIQLNMYEYMLIIRTVLVYEHVVHQINNQ